MTKYGAHETNQKCQTNYCRVVYNLDPHYSKQLGVNHSHRCRRRCCRRCRRRCRRRRCRRRRCRRRHRCRRCRCPKMVDDRE